MKVAMHALDLQAVGLDGFEIGAARDEEHIVSRCRHASAEIAPEGASRHHRDAHCLYQSCLGLKVFA